MVGGTLRTRCPRVGSIDYNLPLFISPRGVRLHTILKFKGFHMRSLIAALLPLISLPMIVEAQFPLRPDEKDEVGKAVQKIGGRTHRLQNGEVYRISLHGTKATDEDLKTLLSAAPLAVEGP